MLGFLFHCWPCDWFQCFLFQNWRHTQAQHMHKHKQQDIETQKWTIENVETSDGTKLAKCNVMNWTIVNPKCFSMPNQKRSLNEIVFGSKDLYQNPILVLKIDFGKVNIISCWCSLIVMTHNRTKAPRALHNAMVATKGNTHKSIFKCKSIFVLEFEAKNMEGTNATWK